MRTSLAGFTIFVLILTSHGLKGQRLECSDYAVQLDGKDDYIDCGNTVNLNIVDHITIECWIKPHFEQRAGFESILKKGADSYGFQFGSDGKKVQFYLNQSLENGQTRWQNLSGGPVLQAGIWYHLAGTYDGNVQKIYLNGELVNTTAWKGKIKLNAEHLSIGKRVDKSDNWFNGTVDEVRVWSVARTAEQVSESMLASLPSNSPGLVAYYQFNEGAGLVTSNLSGSTTAVLVSGPEWVLKSSKEQFITDIFASVPTVLCAGSVINIPIKTPITSECPIDDDNTYIIELSDAKGSFTNSTKLLGQKGKISNSMSVTIPRNIPSGNGYRIRILTSAPATTSPDNGKDITIISSTRLPVSSSGITPLDWILCYEGSTTLSIDLLGEATVQWKKDSVNIEGANKPTLFVNEPGSYYAEVTYPNCRIRTTSNKVVVGPSTILAPTAINGSNCGPGKVLLRASSQFYNPDYYWYTSPAGGTPVYISTATSNPSFTTPFINETTTYYVSLKIGSCESNRVPVKAIVDTVLPKPSISNNGNTNICEGVAILTVPAIEGVKYQWKKDGVTLAKATSDTLLASTPGSYSIVLTNSCGRVASDTITLEPGTTFRQPVIKPLGIPAICPGQILTLSTDPINAATYTWKKNGQPLENNSNELVVTEPGSYQVEVENFCGKAMSSTVEVTQSKSLIPPTIIASGPVSFCEGDSVTLSVSAQEGVQYQWKKDGVSIGENASTYTVTQSGIYELTLLGVCDTVSSSDSIAVTISPAVDAFSIVANGPTTICKTSSVRLSVPILSGVTYEWKKDGNAIGNNSPELVVTEPGSYKVEVLTSCGLQKSDNEVKVTTQAPPPLPVTKDIENCGAGSITLAASGGTDGSYRWYTSPTGGIPISGAVNSKYVTPDLSSTTTYYVAISNGTCESERIAVQAIIHPLPTVNAGTDVAIDFGESTILRGTGTGNYQWTPAVGLSNVNAPDPVARPSETTTYTLTVTSADGCAANDSVTVTVRKDLTIPNAFSPNGDGVNDTWEIDNIQNFPGAKLEIYNRWGSKLYEKVGYSNDWNGTYQGKELPVNTYFYLVTYSVQGQPRKLTGAVSIIR